ncbi:c-type cytochrome [Pedobacter deserti]|uniref:c-type cytochrome n=1 Tax=Pedobacter deserti TaxID=2817382 RepID=UPI00210CB4EC|nr:cytochrome c [Pedobacter sp. SYSU D00382]
MHLRLKFRTAGVLGGCLTFCLIAASCQSTEQLQQDIYYTNGRDLYIKKCQNCHGSKGEGLADLYPPLTDTIWMKSNKHQLPALIKHGKNEMPAAEDMANIDIAQVVVFITNSFGNKQGMYTPEQVASDLTKSGSD